MTNARLNAPRKKATVSKGEQFFVTYYSPARLGIFFAHAKGYDIAI